MKKRILTTVMALTLGAAMLTACGSKPDETTTNETGVVDTNLPEETTTPVVDENADAETTVASDENADTETTVADENADAETTVASDEAADTETTVADENADAESTETAATEAAAN